MTRWLNRLAIRCRRKAGAWFKSTALPTIDRVGGYLDILDTHGIAWERLDSDIPGIILYEDPQQIVALAQGNAAVDS